MAKREITHFAIALTGLLQSNRIKAADVANRTSLAPAQLSTVLSGTSGVTTKFINECLKAFPDKHDKDLLIQAFARDKLRGINHPDTRVLVTINREGEEETEADRQLQDLMRLWKSLPTEKRALLNRLLTSYAPDDDDPLWSILKVYDFKATHAGVESNGK